MDKETLQMANQLTAVIEKEKKAKSLLASALSGFTRAEVDARSVYISARWIIGRDAYAMREDGSCNAAKVQINGEIATEIVKLAIDRLENSIDEHEKQLKEL